MHEWIWEQLNKVNTTTEVLLYLIEVDTTNIISCIVSGHWSGGFVIKICVIGQEFLKLSAMLSK